MLVSELRLDANINCPIETVVLPIFTFQSFLPKAYKKMNETTCRSKKICAKINYFDVRKEVWKQI